MKFSVECPQCGHKHIYEAGPNTVRYRSMRFQSKQVSPGVFEYVTMAPDNFRQEIPYGFLHELITAFIASSVLGLFLGVLVYAALSIFFKQVPFEVVSVIALFTLALGMFWLHDELKLKFKVVAPFFQDLAKRRPEGAAPVVHSPRPRVVLEKREPGSLWWQDAGQLPVDYEDLWFFCVQCKEKKQIKGVDWYPKSQGKLLSQRQWTALRDLLVVHHVLIKIGRTYRITESGRKWMTRIATNETPIRGKSESQEADSTQDILPS